MKRSLLVLAAVLTIGGINPAAATEASFGCDARAPNVCHFRIFYTPRGDRIVILPAGMKANIPRVTIDRDQYCMSLGKNPTSKCDRKVINAKYNS